MKIIVTLVKSPIGYSENQHKVLKALGLGKMGSSVVHDDTPSILGMVRKCAHLVAVENVAE
ncbi:LSU ribosomal protein L30P [Desulfitobacterium dichloroeliminans LMG P-21439]|uniref:Large ribosomal subunit protein uL30 n=1 Tax=Desulfitobacterium dichloroeliminans (strain LMG P-21439 / DCA1) TaxID=871963 RepID=L0F5S7_DESDL|nr:50S ribosomal protein L30 [Desulfitobacterium dichloroeliminans]AGA67996.1 LSU ribosomal protein L30P [Desulfitobacterium dichloroeliminans LMG P-21439]